MLRGTALGQFVDFNEEKKVALIKIDSLSYFQLRNVLERNNHKPYYFCNELQCGKDLKHYIVSADLELDEETKMSMQLRAEDLREPESCNECGSSSEPDWNSLFGDMVTFDWTFSGGLKVTHIEFNGLSLWNSGEMIGAYWYKKLIPDSGEESNSDDSDDGSDEESEKEEEAPILKYFRSMSIEK
jgi:hypothetical protein